MVRVDEASKGAFIVKPVAMSNVPLRTYPVWCVHFFFFPLSFLGCVLNQNSAEFGNWIRRKHWYMRKACLQGQQ